MSNKRSYKAGLVIILLAWLCSLNFYWLILALPVFLIGVLFLWRSSLNIKWKILAAVFPVLLWYPASLAFISFGSRRMTPETFLIPKNFRGTITLVYDEPCGQTVPLVNGRLIYKIPTNGVMIVENQFETGVIDQQYYFVDDNWRKVSRISMLIQQDFNEDYTLVKNKHEPPRNKVGVFLLGAGGGTSKKNDREFKFHELAVNSWEGLRAQAEVGGVSNLVDSLLYECRSSKQ